MRGTMWPGHALDAIEGSETTMRHVTLDEARERLGDLIDSAAKRLIELSEGFDAPLDDFAEYTN